MNLTILIPYDEQLLRRSIRFLYRGQLLPARLLGGLLALLGTVIIASEGLMLPGIALIAAGLALALAIGPVAVRSTIRQQSPAIREQCEVTLDEQQIQASYPLVATQFQWAAFDRVLETPEAWYLSIGKLQALTIPKRSLSPAQQAEFVDFIARRQLGLPQPGRRNRRPPKTPVTGAPSAPAGLS